MPSYIFVPGKRLSEYSSRELAGTILKCLAVGLAVAAVLSSPYGAQRLLKEISKELGARNARERYRIKRTADSLSRKGLVKISGEKNDRTVVLTPKGARVREFDELAIVPRRWDGGWRFFMFDIPERKKGARMALQRKVVAMGMHPFQKSVFISPYPCERELMVAAAFLGVAPFVRFITAGSINNERHFKKAFNL